jgi:DNA-binding SARP family transcriptional activator
MGRYSLETLGTLALRARAAGDDSEGPDRVVLGAGKPAALLAYLALAPAQSALRGECIEMIWSNMPPERARLSLRQALFQLRAILGTDGIESSGQQLVLRAELAVDLLEFQRAAMTERAGAVALFTGRFMESVSFPGGASFERWADLERARAEGVLLDAAAGIVQRALEGGDAEHALMTARHVRDRLPTQQGAWRLLLDTALGAGDRALAVVEADVLERWMKEDDVEPEPALAATLKRIRRAQVDSASSRQEHEVEFVGREEEFSAMLRAFHAAMSSRSRHVHLTGQAGFGKSRMLSEIAQRFRTLRARIAQVTAAASDRSLAYALLARIAETIGALPGASGVGKASAAALVRLAPGLSSAFPATDNVQHADDALIRLLAVRELIDAVASERQLVLLLDDLHWGDRESVETLTRLLERLPSNVLVISASRPPVELRASSTVASLHLAPLSVEQVGALLLSLGLTFDDVQAAASVATIMRATGGSPLLILQTVRQGLERGWLRRDGELLRLDAAADGARELENADPIATRVGELSEKERELLQLLAVAGVALEERWIAGAEGDDANAALHALAARGMVTAGPGGVDVCARSHCGSRTNCCDGGFHARGCRAFGSCDVGRCDIGT